MPFQCKYAALLLFGMFLFWSPNNGHTKKAKPAYQKRVDTLLTQGLGLFSGKKSIKAIEAFLKVQSVIRKLQAKTKIKKEKEWLEIKHIIADYLLGLTYEQTAQFPQAMVSFRRCIQTATPELLANASEKGRKNMKRRLAGAKARINDYLKKKGSTLEIGTLPSADILVTNVNGLRYKGKTPIKILIDPADTRIKISKPGYEPKVLKLQGVPSQAKIKKHYVLTKKATQFVIVNVPQRRKPTKPKVSIKTKAKGNSTLGAWLVAGTSAALAITGGVLMYTSHTSFWKYRGKPNAAQLIVDEQGVTQKRAEELLLEEPERQRGQQTINLVGSIILGVGGAGAIVSFFMFRASSKKPKPTKTSKRPDASKTTIQSFVLFKL